MKYLTRTMIWLAAAALLVAGCPWSSQAKGYSSGSGHSYSSSSSSHSFGSSSSHSFGSSSGHSFGSGSGHSSGSGSKSFGSGGGKSYSSGSTWSDGNRHGYSSGKSYSSGGGGLFGSGSSGDREGRRASPAAAPRQAQPQPLSKPGGMSFDTAAARAKQEEASRRDFNRFKEGQSRSPSDASSAPAYSYQGKPPPIIRSDNAYRQRVFVPDTQVIVTRPGRVRTIFGSYYTRPVVIYQDPYSNLFWWWLLDRSIEDHAWWAYHHRYDMDPARYQALVANDRQLEERVEQSRGPANAAQSGIRAHWAGPGPDVLGPLRGHRLQQPPDCSGGGRLLGLGRPVGRDALRLLHLADLVQTLANRNLNLVPFTHTH